MTYLYDGSFAGLLTAIFTAESAHDVSPSFREGKSYIPDLFTAVREVAADEAKARRVTEALARKTAKEAPDILFSAFLSEETGREDLIHSAIMFCMRKGKGSFSHLEREDIAAVQRLSRKASHEAHMFKGYIRFKNLAEGFYYTAVEPTCDILPLIAGHFKDRFKGQDWVIHDTKRRQALIFMKGILEYAEIADYDRASAERADSDPVYEELWKHYHRTVAIGSRKNPALQMHFIPKKYWGQITEMREKLIDP